MASRLCRRSFLSRVPDDAAAEALSSTLVRAVSMIRFIPFSPLRAVELSMNKLMISPRTSGVDTAAVVITGSMNSSDSRKAPWSPRFSMKPSERPKKSSAMRS